MKTNPKHSTTQKNDCTEMTRKDILKKMGRAVNKLALASIPLVGSAATAEEAKAQPRKPEISRLLNMLLQMEFVEQNFYVFSDIDAGLVPAPYFETIQIIKRHKIKHVRQLKLQIDTRLDVVLPSPPLSATYNINGLNPKDSFEDFLQMAQVLANASISLYKRNVPKVRKLNINPEMGRMLLRIHTMKARHVAYIRMIRKERGIENLKPWISSTLDNSVHNDFQNLYVNEDNTTQSDIDVTTVTSVPPFSVREAWDESCTNQAINNLFNLLNVNYY